MNNQASLQPYFLLAALAMVAVLAFFIFRPLLPALVLAAAFAVVFQPLYRRLLPATGRPALAALSATIIVVAFLMIPLALIGGQIFQEARQLYTSYAIDGGQDSILNVLRSWSSRLGAYLPAGSDLPLNLDQYFERGLNWLVANLGGFFSNLARIIASTFIFLVALYYFFKDGATLKKKIVAISPLANRDDEFILQKLAAAVNAVIKGSLTIACIQGILTSIGFAIFGLAHPVLWGTVAAVAALIPGVGTALVILPAVIYLFLYGSTAGAIGLLVWGVAAVGLIDNFLGPKLVGRSSKLHPLAVFLSVIGGIVFFGPLGFLLGPLTMSLLFALLDIYSYVLKID